MDKDNYTLPPYFRNIKPATKYTTIWAGRNEHIAYMATQGRDPEQVERDMDFILRACNAYEDMVEALDYLDRIPLDHFEALAEGQVTNIGFFRVAKKKAKAALAKARGDAA